MIETNQYIRCLMKRKSKREEKATNTVKPFRGGVLFFHAIPDATGKHAAWGIWQYYYTPYFGHEGGEPDALCPPNVPIKKRKDCYANGPMRQGVFYNREFIDREKIRWLKSYCEKTSLGLADLDGFNWSVLLATQPVGWSRGHYLYDRDSPKLICALEFENHISRLAYDSREGKNTQNDRLGHASTVYELCPCESRKRKGEEVPRCYHRADVKIKHLGEVIAVKGQRIDWDSGNQQSAGDETEYGDMAIGNRQSEIDNQESAAVDSLFQFVDTKPKRIELLRFLPINQFFQALSVATKRIPDRLTLNPSNIKLWFSFLEGLHKDYIKARNTFERYKLDIPIWHVYSGGSIARSVLHNLGIAPFRKQNPHIGFDVLSKFRAADCGGRICTLKTGTVVPAAHLDFKSQYPAVCLLLGLQDLLTAERFDLEERPYLPAAVRDITLEKLFNRLTWLELRGIALVKPDKDWLPFHSQLGLECRIVESGEPFWVTLPDICASILRTGKVPDVLQSIVLKPSGIQDGIRAGQFFSVGERNPLKDDLFLEAVFSKETGDASKAAVNSLGYGIHSQINQEPGPQAGKFTLWCNGASNALKSNEKNSGGFFPTETPGEYYGPFGTLITGGGRLLLTMLELAGERHGLKAIYMNTDCAVFECPNEMDFPDFSKRINQIRDTFESLSPYSSVPAEQRPSLFLKIEKQNLSGDDGAFRLINFFAVSPERYAEYTVDKGEIVIRHLTLSHTSELYDPLGYKSPSIARASLAADACDALETRQSLGDYWLILLKLVEKGLRGTHLEEALRIEIDKNKSLQRTVDENDPMGLTYADKIAEYLKILPPDESEPVSLTRQYIIGKDPPDGEDEAPLFEFKQGKIVPIYSGRMAATAQDQSNVVVRLYKAKLLVPFIRSLKVPEYLKDLAISQIQQRLENGDLDRIYVLFDRYIHTDESGHPKEFEMRAEAFLKRAMRKKNSMPEKGARAMHEIKRARKASELERACRKSGLSPEAYKKAKQTVKRLKGSNDWLPQLDANDLGALDAMMNDWRSSGMDYFSWRDKERKEREREASDRREAWHVKHNEIPEDKAARRRTQYAESKRLARAAAAETTEIDVVSTKTLTPPHVRLLPERDACHGSGSKRRTASPEPVFGHKQDFKVGMAVVQWRDGDAEDAKTRVLPPTFAAELAAATLGLNPEELARIKSATRKNEKAENADENIRIYRLGPDVLANVDFPLEIDPTASPSSMDPQPILEHLERELAGTATLEAVKKLLSHLDSKGISNIDLLNGFELWLKESRPSSISSAKQAMNVQRKDKKW